MNNLDKQYQDLLMDILYKGALKSDRTGTGTISVFGRQIIHDMSEGFPLLTTKKMAIKTMMTELKWFLKGDTNIKYLVENGCHIWDGDAYKNYVIKVNMQPGVSIGDFLTKEEFIEEIKSNDDFNRVWGQLGPIYGKQWRDWNNIGYGGDQITNLLLELKDNPDSRRLMVSAWNVAELDEMVLPPCHYGFQVYTRELLETERFDWYAKKIGSFMYHDRIKQEMDQENVPKRSISLSWNQRSVDTFLGLPFNIASYGMLLSLLAHEVNMVPEHLIGNLGDTHLYLNHLEQAKEQVNRDPKPYLPKLKLNKVDILNGEFDYEIKNYEYHPTIKAPLSN